MKNGKIITFRLPSTLHEKLAEQAAIEGATISDVARTIIGEHNQISSVLSKFEELDISRRFRELYGQARCAVIGLDVLARATLGDKYNEWLSEVKERLDEEANNKRGR